MTKIFLKWWLMVVIQIVIVGTAAAYNYHWYVLENDATYLSPVIIVLWVITTYHIGKRVYTKKDTFEIQWFTAEACMTIGMIGTVIGFLMMLGDSFANLDIDDTSAMRETISSMAVGLSTALITTLNGLVASLFLKVQIGLVEHSDET